MAVCVEAEEREGFLGVHVDGQLAVFGDVAGDAGSGEAEDGYCFSGGVGVGREVERGLVEFMDESGVQLLLLGRWVVSAGA
ncbi:hypothetical protein ABZ023_34260 [Streptomyces sp. NPDC006367]|uniref:hypothetical protein n=1 Tax=unclassified Streptomyces TaxID=2593676 RepID=UPI0033BE0879